MAPQSSTPQTFLDKDRPNYVKVDWGVNPDGKIVTTLTHKFPKKRKSNGRIRF